MISKKMLSLSILTLALTACTTAQPIVGPDGTTNQLITCMTSQLCYEKAHEICGQYKIVNTTTEQDGKDTVVKMLVKCGR